MLNAIIIASIIAGVTPFISFFTSKWIEDGKRRRAFQRLMAEPLLSPMRYRIDLYTPNHGAKIVEDGLVENIDVGRVSFVWKEARRTYRTSFTGQEVEQLIWVAREVKTGEGA